MTKLIYILLISFILFPNLVNGQDADLKVGQRYEPIYSQYWVNGLAINPAYTGSRECFSNTILYRNQWMGFDGAPITQTLSSHAPLKDEKNAVGLFIFHESIGVTDYYDIYGNYAFRFQLGEGRISLGLKVGATFFQGNYSDIEASPEGLAIDPILDSESEVFPNFGVGAYYYTDKFYLGLSVPKFLSYEIKSSKKTMYIGPENYDFLITGGILLGQSKTLKFKPSFLFRYRLDNTYQIDIGANVIFYDVLWLGGSYRYNDEFAFMIEYQVSNQIRAGVAYDFATGDLVGQHGGSLELILRYEFRYKIRAVNPRYF